MTDEAAFQRLLREHPDDHGTLIVYADWLESQGDTHRAAVVRLHDQLLAVDDRNEQLAVARQLLAHADAMPRAWLDTLTTRPIADTCWGARVNSEPYLVRFGGNGCPDVRQLGEDGEDYPTFGDETGSWMQVGRAMAFALGNKEDGDFSRHEGVVVGDVMHGIGSNSEHEEWSWSMVRLPLDLFFAPTPVLPPELPVDGQHTDAPRQLAKRRWT
jgi:uncharacterized protein (TIGR02996 family)